MPDENHAERLARARVCYGRVSGATVRDASEDDAPACAAIYAPYVRETAVSFEASRRRRADGRTIGWRRTRTRGRARRRRSRRRLRVWRAAREANGLPFLVRGQRLRRAGRRRSGSGRALYEALFNRLAARGYLMAVAGMTLPNEASVGLHRAMASSRSASTGGLAGSSARARCRVGAKRARRRAGPSAEPR